MGQDENIIEPKISAKLIEMGKKAHKYRFNVTLDKFLPNYYIKKIYSRTISTPHHGTQYRRVSRESATRVIRTETCQYGIILLLEPWLLKLFFFP